MIATRHHHQTTSRRSWLTSVTAAAATASLLSHHPRTAHAGEFTPGGTLVDYEVGPLVGNPEASASRKPDNSNVLFDRDYYFKFGTAAPWIEPGSTDFPKSMPFTKSQQRYDALKEYKDRILAGIANIRALEKAGAEVADPRATDVYYLRPMGLLANAFLASENTGSTNELFLVSNTLREYFRPSPAKGTHHLGVSTLYARIASDASLLFYSAFSKARYYINEILLGISDMRAALTPDDDARRKKIYNGTVKKAVNSYLALMNRVITEKVGDKFVYI